MLEGENCRGRKNGDLFACGNRLEGARNRHFGFAVADVAAEQAVHRRWLFEIFFDVRRWRVRWSAVSSNSKASRIRAARRPSGENAKPSAVLTLGVERKQLVGHDPQADS